MFAGAGAVGGRGALGQQPVGIGPSIDPGLVSVAGLVKWLDWYHQIGPAPQGDFYYFSAWLPNASGLPVSGGKPIVGTYNDGHMGSLLWKYRNPSIRYLGLGDAGRGSHDASQLHDLV